MGKPIYNSICLFRGQEIGPPGTPRKPQKWTTLYGEGCPEPEHNDAFSAQGPHAGTPAFRLRTHHARHRAGRSSEGGGRREGQGEETTRRAPQRKKGRAKVRTARHKVCPLLWEACGAVRARTGVGTPFPLRLLAQTYALWRGVISEGLPSSELWETPYIIVYVYFGDRKLLRRGPHGGPLKWTKLYAAGCPVPHHTDCLFGSRTTRGDPRLPTKDSPCPPPRGPVL